MNKYQRGKIYKIISVGDPPEDCYIGSTVNKYLCNRLAHHLCVYRKNKNSCSVIKLFDKYGTDDIEIILLETYPCNSKDELRAREEHWRQQIPNINYRSCHKRDKEKRKASNLAFGPKRKEKLHCDICNIDINRYGIKKHEISNSHIKKLNTKCIDGPNNDQQIKEGAIPPIIE